MTIGLSYNPDLSRVRITISDVPSGLWRIERSTNQLFWQTVRGGAALPVVDGTAALDDFEFAADVTNFYRAVPQELENLMVVYTANGTFVKADFPGLVAVRVRCRGGGGSGGGATTTAASEHSTGAGGGQGGYAESIIAAASLGASVTVTIGNGGAGVSGAAGDDGGATSFGAHVVANGGLGGRTQNATASEAEREGGAGGTGVTGQLLIRGAPGGNAGQSSVNNRGGPGGGEGAGQAASANNMNGVAGVGGGGGSGASNGASQVARTGGAGGSGWVIVENIFWPPEV